MHNLERLSLDEMEEFIAGSRTVAFAAKGREMVYGFIECVLKQHPYRKLSKGQRGIVRRFLVKVTGLSRAQVTRLIAGWRKTRRVRGKPPHRPSFPRRYTPEDVALLAKVDAAHEELSGPAVRRICQREYAVFGQAEFERLAGISVAHLYNLRGSETYRNHRVRVHHT